MTLSVQSLPMEIPSQIWEYVDYKTKFRVLSDRHTYLLDPRSLSNIFNKTQFKLLYNEGYVKKVSYLDTSNRRREINDNIKKLLPYQYSYQYVNLLNEIVDVNNEHELLWYLRSTLLVKMNTGTANSIINTINMLFTISSNVFELDNIFNKLAYDLAQSVVYYKKILDNRFKIYDELLLQNDEHIRNEKAIEKERIRNEKAIEKERIQEMIKLEKQRQKFKKRINNFEKKIILRTVIVIRERKNYKLC